MQCDACTEAIDPGSRFCQWCGKATAGGVAPRSVAPDRRYATVLFADIVDSTSMVRDLEPELALERLSPILEAMKRAITEYGGTICRDQGDGVMAVFGAPVSDDRHAINACMAGIALLDQTAASGALPAACRVGIHSGLVVSHAVVTSSGSSYGVSGEAVHLASRLESAARIGTVLISEATHKLTDGRFEFRERRLANLKGFDREFPAFEIGHLTSLSQWNARTWRSSMEFMGRDRELAQLMAGYADSGLNLVVVSGDPAIGKSRLVHEFVDRCVLSHASVHAALCEQNLSRTPYAALRHVVLSILRLPAEASGEQVDLGLAAYARRTEMQVLWDEMALRFFLGRPVTDQRWSELEPATKHRRISSVLADILAFQATDGARNVILVEDIHWADPASIAVLDTVKAKLGGEAFYFVVTTRDPDALRTNLIAGDGSLLLQLDPLGKDACERILDGLLGRSPTLLRLKGRLLDLGGGTALFLHQLVQWLVDSRALVGNPSNYRLAVHADQLQLPASLHAVTLWRVDRLPMEARHVLSLAAVLQHDIGVSEIAHMSGLGWAQVRPELDLLVERGLLVQESTVGEPRFSFRHTLLRESVYDSLPRDRRLELHALALQFLESLPDRHSHREGMMAMHAYASQNWKAVAEYSRIVGDRALAASAYRDAAGHFEHAIDALYRLPRDRATLVGAIDARLQARLCYSAMAKHDLCLAHISRADELAREIGDSGRVLACSIYRAGVLNFTGPVHESLMIGVEALAAARSSGSVPHIAIAGYVLGQAHYAAGNFREAVRAFAAGGEELVGEKALTRLGTTGTAAAMCFSLKAASHASLGEFSDAAACLARSGDIANQTARPYDIVSHAYAEGITHSLQEKGDQAIEAFERALNTCRKNDIETFVTTLSGQLGHAYLLAGRVAPALELLEPALEEALMLQNLPQVATLKRQLGFAALCQGDLMRAERLAREAGEMAALGGYRMIQSSCLHLEAMVGLRMGGRHLGAAASTIERSSEIARTLGAVPALFVMRATRAEIRQALELERAETNCQSGKDVTRSDLHVVEATAGSTHGAGLGEQEAPQLARTDRLRD